MGYIIFSLFACDQQRFFLKQIIKQTKLILLHDLQEIFEQVFPEKFRENYERSV